MRSGRSELHDFLASYGRHDLPVTLRLLWLHQLPVMPEDQSRVSVPDLQCQLCRIVELGKMVRGEAVPQRVLRPVSNSRRFTCTEQQLRVTGRCHRTARVVHAVAAIWQDSAESLRNDAVRSWHYAPLLRSTRLAGRPLSSRAVQFSTP